MTLKKIVLSLSLLTSASFAFQRLSADTPVTVSRNSATETKSDFSPEDSYIQNTYERIDFTGKSRLNADVFHKAMTGYMNLKAAGRLGRNEDILTVCDFSLSSKQRRMWIINLKSGKVLFNELVAHGQGSGDEYATAFSNLENSHQSSLGFYVTNETYGGAHGLSLRLDGMDRGFNDAALGRGVVVHGAPYVSDGFVSGQNRLGRSWGCPAVADAKAPAIINTIKGGSCMFIYAADKRYAKASFWMNHRINQVPDAMPTRNTQIAALTPVQRKMDTVLVHVPAATTHAPVSLF